jgi:5'-methylthioadenosine phosphorylase
MLKKPVLGVIGGSGLYAIEGLENVEQLHADTPFGEPSSPIVLGDLNGKRVAFLARHGIGHVLAPGEVNYRANIYALRDLGVERVVSVSACGSLREDYEPGDIVVPDQIFDRTHGRKASFFEQGFVAHISVADPFCPDMARLLVESVAQADGTIHEGGAYVIIPGPRFSTRAESNTYRAWGMSIVGMTTAPEAFLAREAEMCYIVMAHVTDYDVWHSAEEPVTVEMVFRTIKANTELAKRTILKLVDSLPASRDCTCGDALKDALTTDPAHIPAGTRKKLSILVDRYLD